MTTFSLRSLLLLTSALTLIACDEGSEEHTNDLENTPPPIIGFYQPTQMPVIKTTAGSYLSGQHAQLHNDWEKASEFFEDVLQKKPGTINIERRVMALSLGAGNFERSTTLANILINKDKSESLAQLILALDDFNKEDYQSTLKRIDSIPSDGLSSTISPIVKSWSLAALGKTDYSLLKDSPSFLYQTVLIADYIKDKNTIKDLAKKHNFTHTSTPINALEDIADIFARHEKKQEANEIYHALKNAIPEESDRLTKKINAPASLENTPIPQTPQQGLSKALLDTAVLLSNGYEDSSLLFAQMARRLNPKNNDIYEILAQIMAYNEQYTQAITYLSKINTKEDSRKEQEIQRQIAAYLEMEKKQDESIRILTNLVEQYQNIDAQIQIGDIYRQNENYKDALTSYNKAINMLGKNISQEHWHLLFARGIANERTKNWEAAEKDLTAALIFEPDQPYILNYLGYSWADQGKNLDKAIEMIKKAARLKPTDGAIIDSLGWAYFKMGEFEDSVKTLESAVELQPYESEINDHLGDAYWQVGRKTEARFQWKRAASFTKDIAAIEKIKEKIENGLPQNITRKSKSDSLVAND